MNQPEYICCRMRLSLAAALIFGGCLCYTRADARTSANYALATEAQDAGGRKVASANYSVNSGIGAIGGLSTSTSTPEVLKSGYVGQIYDPVSLSVSASPTNLNEGTTRQLAAAQTMDDGSALALPASGVAWSVVSGPIGSVSAGGLATAGWVYRDTPATVGGCAGGFSASLTLLVANVTSDDFGLYAGDGIDDDWQVSFFGIDNPDGAPDQDPDGDSQNNLFESLALVIPTDPSSRFQFRAVPTPGTPAHVDLVFGPIRDGRTYTVQHIDNLSLSSWTDLSLAPHSDSGDERTVTLPIAGAPKGFYRIQIGR